MKTKPKKWSRKGKCPSCSVGTGSSHSKNCKAEYKPREYVGRYTVC